MNILITGSRSVREHIPYGDFLNPYTAKLLPYGVAVAMGGNDCDNVARGAHRVAFNVLAARAALEMRHEAARQDVAGAKDARQARSAGHHLSYLAAALNSMSGPGGDESDGTNNPSLWGNPDYPGHY